MSTSPNDKMNENDQCSEMKEDTKTHEILNKAIEKLRSHNVEDEIITFLELVSQEQLLRFRRL